MSDPSRLLSAEQIADAWIKQTRSIECSQPVWDHISELESQLIAEQSAHQQTRELLGVALRVIDAKNVELARLLAQQRTDQQTIERLETAYRIRTEDYHATAKRCDSLAATLARVREMVEKSIGYDSWSYVRDALAMLSEPPQAPKLPDAPVQTKEGK